MSRTIFYFSGTGNSLAVAHTITGKLPDASVIPLAGIVNSDKPYQADADDLIFVFPVYVAGIPALVARALAQIKITCATYIAAVVTCDSSAGAALGIFNNELNRHCGRQLDAGWIVYMPGNYTPLYGADSPKKVCAKLEVAETRINEIATAVHDRQKHKLETLPVPFCWLPEISSKMFTRNVWQAGRRFRASADCIGCGLCVKVCPVNNIVLSAARRPQWQNHCEQCMACLQFCPVEAIQCFWWTRGRRRYRHPQVTVEKLVTQKSL
ncbi:MAG: EFR1 family ferrodoxin [Candidatus Riflebacteria bacterium]|nr:EFR1 family ferrodoxin [Candidatus Riflebacteria bacterium]